jgi:aerobic carbon-monoxide dehydrogenase medium subunit
VVDAAIRADRREVWATDFFVGPFETALEENEIVVAVSFEAPDASACEKFRNPASRHARCGGEVRVGVTGAGGAFP